MTRFLLWGALGLVAVIPSRPLWAKDGESWETSELAKLSGCWTSVRSLKAANEKTSEQRVKIEFVDGALKAFIYNENGKIVFDGRLNVMKVEKIKAAGVGSISRLHLRGSPQQMIEVYYDFVGTKLILVGVVGFRPWEGFHLSGEYTRLITIRGREFEKP